MKQSLNLGFSLSPLILLPPIFDLLLTFGKGMSISYYKEGFTGSMVETFFSFLPYTNGFGPSIGLRITMFMLLVILSMYVYYFTKSKLKSLLIAVITYITFFIVIFHPFLLSKLNFGYIYSDYSSMIFYLITLSILTLIVLYFYDLNTSKKIVNDLLISRIIYQCILFLFGYLYIMPESIVQQIPQIILFFYALFCACIFSIITNNIEDKEIDKISNSNRSTQHKDFNEKRYYNYGIIFLFISLLISFSINFILGYFLSIWLLIYYIYSCSPFRLKKVPLFSKFLLSFNSLILFVAGYYFANNNQYIPFEIAILYLIFLSLAYNVIDLKDYYGDKKGGIKTIVGMCSSLLKAKILISFFFLLLYIYYMYLLNFEFYLLVILGYLGLIYLLLQKEYSDSKVMAFFVSNKLVVIYLLIFII